jgi:hypothetical protein
MTIKTINQFNDFLKDNPDIKLDMFYSISLNEGNINFEGYTKKSTRDILKVVGFKDITTDKDAYFTYRKDNIKIILTD